MTATVQRTTNDHERVIAMLQTLAPCDSIQSVVVTGEPTSKGRARYSRGHWHTPTKTSRAQAEVAGALARLSSYESNVAVAAIFCRSNAQRLDVDNLLKLVLDAATQASLWEDDSQVTALVGILELDEDRPRTIVGFAEHESTMVRGRAAWVTCAHCGVPFKANDRQRAKYCSKACLSAGRSRLAAPVPCAQCGAPFRRKTELQKFCSMACVTVNRRGRPKGTRKPPALCVSCGAPVSKRGYDLCRACWCAKGKAA